MSMLNQVRLCGDKLYCQVLTLERMDIKLSEKDFNFYSHFVGGYRAIEMLLNKMSEEGNVSTVQIEEFQTLSVELYERVQLRKGRIYD